MRTTDVIVIGGGQAGLAISHCLSDHSLEHVVLERGRIAERWRSERWDSLRLLTPNWQSRLPGWEYRGGDPSGYMTAREVTAYLEGYAASLSAPIEEDTSVVSVERSSAGYEVTTNRGRLRASNVVLATGYCDRPYVPAIAHLLSPRIAQLVPTRYRNPSQLAPGGVLIVGASATGVQLADELQRSGRDVTLAVGRHTRLPRSYRGLDIMWWLDRCGILDQGIDEVRDIEASRRQPSLQLVGRTDRSTLDLQTLQQRGVRLVGRAVAAAGNRVMFADNLRETTAHAARRLERLLARIDQYAALTGVSGSLEPIERPQPVDIPEQVPTSLDLRAQGIGTVIWATGYRRQYPWLQVPVLSPRGEIVHEGGITRAPGLYALGLMFMRRRKSSFLDGVGADARDIADHIAERLNIRAAAA